MHKTLIHVALLTILVALAGCASKAPALHCEYHSTNTQVRVTAVTGGTATVAGISGGNPATIPLAEFPEAGVSAGQVYEATDKRIKSGACLPHYYYIKRLVRNNGAMR